VPRDGDPTAGVRDAHAPLRDLVPRRWRSYLEGCAAVEGVDAFLADEERAGRAWHPDRGRIFRALALCPPERLVGVAIGQDPYPRPGQPTGLAFDLPDGRMSPSARAILDEYAADLGLPRPARADLTSWAARGLLLWNSAATTTVGLAGAHARSGWHEVTRHLLAEIVRRHEGLVFVCWGSHAQALVLPLLDGRHRSIRSNHPSPLSARRPPVPFVGSRPFSRFNDLRAEMGRPPMDWALPA
jgi:uracil-DNA glycosylase